MQRSAPRRPDSDPAEWWWVFDPRFSLPARAALIFGGAAAAFTLVLANVCGTFLRDAVEQRLRGEFETLAFQMSDKLDRTVYQRFHELQLAAGLGPFRSSEVTATERRQLLEALQDAARDFAWIGFADTDGRVRAATRGHLEGAAVGNNSWYLLGREKPYAATLHDLPALTRLLTPADEERTAKYIDLAVPLQAASGQFLGVLGAHVQWDWAREVQLSVVPEILRKERIGLTVYGANGEVLLDSGGSGWTLPPDAPAIADPRRFRGAQVENTSTGTVYLTGFARSRGYREYRGFGWLITVRQPRDLALAPARALQHRITGWGLAFAGVIGVTAWFAAGRLTRRFRGIGHAARRIREGDILTVLPRPKGEAEIDRMCRDLGNMVDTLREKPPGPKS